MPVEGMMGNHFKTALCVDGSVSDPRKRPVFHVDIDAKPSVSRYAHAEGLLAITFDEVSEQLEKPILVTADVPIGLPDGFDAVRGTCVGFIEWLERRGGRSGWNDLVADSIADQTAARPFVLCKKGEKKTEGKFPWRRCDVLTQAESLFWCVGGKQVGKAALQFWHDTLLPLRTHFGDRLAVWPFEDITAQTDVVVAECYPAILYSRVWGRRVTKSNPVEVVDAVDRMRSQRADLASERSWLHAASSEDEFDMFTVSVEIATRRGVVDELLTAPQEARPWEGWMLGLPKAVRS